MAFDLQRATMMRHHGNGDRGMTLFELLFVFVIAGLIIAFSVPSYQRFSGTANLKSGATMIVGEIRLARSKAIGTGRAQTIRFKSGDYCTVVAVDGGAISATRNLPRGIRYDWSVSTFPDSDVALGPDGRADQSGLIVVKNQRGDRDSVKVYTSGLVHVQ
jgi:type II secretory pathway pseudopilin PulG